MFSNNCIICLKTFEAKAINAKTCSEQCFIEHRKNRRAKIKKENATEHTCKNCGETYKRDRKRNGFCSRSCASNYYYNKGDFKQWQQTGMELNLAKKKPLIEMTCIICKKQYSIKEKEHKRNRSKTCSIKCRAKYAGRKSVEQRNYNTQVFVEKALEVHGANKYDYSLVDYKHPHENIIIICNKKNHGPFKQTPNNHLRPRNCPRCRSTISNGQKNLYEELKANFNKNKIILEKTIKTFKSKNYRADICFVEDKIIIEYHGDYWHCNPEKYESNYFNTRKNKTAKDIWEEDKQRQKTLEDLGYKVLIVWESDFKNSKQQVIKTLHKEIITCQRN